MTTNDRCTVRGQQLTVSAYIHRVLTRAGISLVAAATFASAHAADGDKKPILVAANDAAAAPATPAPAADPPPRGPTAAAEESNADTGSTISEVTVSGSRIHRTDGFEAPTPVAVMDSSILDQMSTTTLAESLTRMPQFSSNLSSSNLSSNVVPVPPVKIW